MREYRIIPTRESGPTAFLLHLSFPEDFRLAGFYSASCTAQRIWRADAFNLQEDRIRCLSAGWLVRQATERLLGVPGIHESHDERGAPRLPEAPEYSLSISHSGPWVACALKKGGEIGIDAEGIPDTAEGVEHIFMSPAELGEYRCCRDAQQRMKYFHSLWCLKECWLKASGTGMLRNPADVTICAGKEFLSVTYDTTESWNWHAEHLEDGALLAMCWR